jgi:hypothetical protein
MNKFGKSRPRQDRLAREIEYSSTRSSRRLLRLVVVVVGVEAEDPDYLAGGFVPHGESVAVLDEPGVPLNFAAGG